MDKYTWTSEDGKRKISVTSEQLAEFRDQFVQGELASRISMLFWFDMYFGSSVQALNCHAVMDAIRNVEAGDPHSGVKASDQFKHLPLKGLWKKHYFSAQFLLENVRLGHGKNVLEKLVNEIIDPTKHTVVTEQMINELAYRATFEPLAQRSSAGRLTGEWVIFARSGGANYFLSLGRHNVPDQMLYDRIMEHCVSDFPKLPTWFG